MFLVTRRRGLVRMPKPLWTVFLEVQFKNLYRPSGHQPSIVGGRTKLYCVPPYGCFLEIRQHAHAVDGVQIPWHQFGASWTCVFIFHNLFLLTRTIPCPRVIPEWHSVGAVQVRTFRYSYLIKTPRYNKKRFDNSRGAFVYPESEVMTCPEDQRNPVAIPAVQGWLRTDIARYTLNR